MRRNNRKGLLFFLLLSVVIALLFWFIYSFFINSSSNQAEAAVEEFYLYEQAGAFSDSWEMFHPYMKERFEKGHYLQDRAHVFLNHFGVNTFTFSLEDAELLRNWQIEEDSEPIEEVYKVEVTQYYEGKYGNFALVQEVYATSLDGEWTVLWDYKKSETTLEPDEN
ncbi:hypothetical protein [Ornithinibacillus californiensis]|uniref:hypothetical protein n=1 Tax=Ornithinibacillus californiensis TaxID=161536 RepID=UPI00064D8F47|nr:hypothetical protein [Ornithinibacillus californiensis]